MKSLGRFRTQGFSLFEVLVALVIISIGLLGIAAMQASALSNTHTSQNESIIAIQARSLADAMTANPAYWNAGLAPTSAFSVLAPAAGSSVATITNTTLATSANCATAVCDSAASVAAYDVQQWGKQLIPNSAATISCQTGSPVVCTIQMIWQQKSSTAINAGTGSTPSETPQTMTYTLVNQV